MSVLTMGDDLCDGGLGLTNASVQTKDGKTVDSIPVVEQGDDHDSSFWDDMNNWGGN